MSRLILNRPLYILNVLFLGLILQGCQPSQQDNRASEQGEPSQKLAYFDEFEAWKKTQDPKLLEQYQNFFKDKVKQQPTLYELTLNSHPLKEECQQYRFSLPPKKLWANLIPSLQLIENLQGQNYFAHYKIISVYRSREANNCVHGAKGSKHLNNFAVDFRTYNENKQHYADTQKIEQQLCQFWRGHGKQHAMGFGVYGKQRFHIDTQAYRTWGIGFKAVSSPCLKK